MGYEARKIGNCPYTNEVYQINKLSGDWDGDKIMICM